MFLRHMISIYNGVRNVIQHSSFLFLISPETRIKRRTIMEYLMIMIDIAGVILGLVIGISIGDHRD